MSIDIALYINTGVKAREVCDVGNYTHNVQPMWSYALNESGAKFAEGAVPLAWWNDQPLSLCAFDGMACREAIPLLEEALAHMNDPANLAVYLAMNPKNGWGNFYGAREYLRNFLENCKGNPLCVIGVSC